MYPFPLQSRWLLQCTLEGDSTRIHSYDESHTLWQDSDCPARGLPVCHSAWTTCWSSATNWWVATCVWIFYILYSCHYPVSNVMVHTNFDLLDKYHAAQVWYVTLMVQPQFTHLKIYLSSISYDVAFYCSCCKFSLCGQKQDLCTLKISM